MKTLLRKLTEAFGPSGYEDEVREVVRQEIESFVDEINVDALGNLIAHKRPARNTKNSKRIMIAAHLDEIGLVVSHVDQNGFVHFSPLGSLRRRYLLGSRVRFSNGIRGVIGGPCADGPGNVNELPALDKLYIDVGAQSRNDCPVQVGDVASFDGSYQELGDRLVAKSMDNRVGVWIAIETLRNLKSALYDIAFVFTAQQEVGARGAIPAAYGLDPDLGIALDVLPAGDLPFSRGKGSALGKGPCLKIQDARMIADTRIVNWMIRAAEKNKIPYQREAVVGESSDAISIQHAREGVPSGCISIPVRYLHSSSEIVEPSDVQNTVKLLAALLHSQIEL